MRQFVNIKQIQNNYYLKRKEIKKNDKCKNKSNKI